ncbi:MAG: XrtA/PEP-CTERM system-associated ATPase [Pseudomonadota bacterium]
MYEEFFGFSGAPFRLNPDPKFFFGSRSHNKAMAYLHYGLKQAEGFIVITGPVGAGKSMIIGHLLDQLNRSNVVAAHLVTSSIQPTELLSHILSTFRIEPEGEGRSGQLEALEDFLFDQMNRGRRVLLILDEAQNLPIDTLEELRMLTNIDYEGTPLFQVFLVGQPEFRDTLKKPNMEQLSQRVIASYHLEALSEKETREYVEHRLAIVGWNKNPKFTDDAFKTIHQQTHGRPRRINTLCNRVLLHCSIEKKRTVDQSMVQTVLSELKAESDHAEFAESRQFAAKEEIVDVSRSDGAVEVGSDSPVRADQKVVVPFPKSNPEVNTPSAIKRDEKPAVSDVKPTSGDAAKGLNPAQLEEKNKPPAPKTKPADPALAQNASGEIAPMASIESPLSVLDQIKAQKKGIAIQQSADAEHRSPEPATLSDVANAIASATIKEPKAIAEKKNIKKSKTTVGAKERLPLMMSDPTGWRQSVVKSISDIRSELRASHIDVEKLRRKLGDVESKRLQGRAKIVSSLAEAERILKNL